MTRLTGSALSTPDQNTVAQERKRPRGIFLHTGWRSAGTWVWSRFRVLPSVTAFYEPLHPILGDLRLADIPSLEPTWTSGHPPLNTPYFTEYRSLMREHAHGVTGYRKSFSTDRFGTVPDAGFPALQTYLANLCDQTTDQGKTPVFKFCRSLGRLPWLKNAFPDAMHAVVLRNPASQFASGWLLHQQWSNPFFVAAPFRVLGLNQAEPIVEQVIEVCGVRLPSTPVTSIDEYAAACEQYARTVEGANAYRAFVALWILCALRSADADLLFDLDRLGRSSEYASSLRAQIRAQTDLTPDFTGARDLVKETTRASSRVKGIDGRLIRPVHFSAQNFVVSQRDSMGSRTDVTETIKEKLALASELSEQWRY
jgi:hypothetical protein